MAQSDTTSDKLAKGIRKALDAEAKEIAKLSVDERIIARMSNDDLEVAITVLKCRSAKEKKIKQSKG